nr:reverse transcriptase domain-containing protein [Tanacetum cinerariifolium]
MYLSATYGAISTVLMTERGVAQMPIYFISRALQGPELNYSPMEKLVLSLIFTAKRLRRYFQAHPIVVITDQPIKKVMSRPDVAGRLQKWSIMLGEHNITYRPRTSIKGQILADFLIEMLGQGVYYYTKMPFGPKNAGATYQRLMNKAFEGQVGRNIEVYVDDLVIKSYTEAAMVRDIEETFRTLRKVNMKLNPKKCLFGLAEGVFLGRGGIATIRSTLLIPTECASVTTSSVIPRGEGTCPANFTVALHPDFPNQKVVIGGSLSDMGHTEL